MPISKIQQSELNEQLQQTSVTRRATVAAMEDILYQVTPVLDHGFVRVIDYMGNDAAIVQAARVSYGQGTKSVRDDEALIRYLVQNQHTSPFEMCEVKLHVKLPIFVARQWVRHRTASINEQSARYSVLSDEFYVPGQDRIQRQSRANRQGSGDRLSEEDSRIVAALLEEDARKAYSHYRELVAESDQPDTQGFGVSRELARIGLPVSIYTEWYWKIDLRNLLHFLKLRLDEHAQFEIRAYAQVIHEIAKKWVPQAVIAFEEFELGATRLTGKEVEILGRILRGEDMDQAASGLSSREWSQLQGRFGLAKGGQR